MKQKALLIEEGTVERLEACMDFSFSK